jgi:hypothetical protein
VLVGNRSINRTDVDELRAEHLLHGREVVGDLRRVAPSCAYCRGPTPRQPQLVWTTDFAESDEFGELALIDVCWSFEA